MTVGSVWSRILSVVAPAALSACTLAGPAPFVATLPPAAAPTETPFLPRGFEGVAEPAAPGPVPPAVTSIPTPDMGSVFAALNAIRLDQGRPGFRAAPTLDRLAQERADSLARSPNLLAGGEAGDPEVQRALEVAGYHGILVVQAAVVLASEPDPVGVALQALLTDPDHRGRLLDHRLRYLGLGAAGDGERWFLVQVLAEGGPDDIRRVPDSERDAGRATIGGPHSG